MKLLKMQGRGKRKKKRIKAMELPKLWGEGKKKELWQLSCRKYRGGKKKECGLLKLEREKKKEL